MLVGYWSDPLRPQLRLKEMRNDGLGWEGNLLVVR